ncbi:hypothetical protein JCM10207_004818 [Rhodosporidiobolus poonsookiae]
MSYFLPLPGAPVPSFTGSTLLLPQPSLASLAQLAADLLVHNYASELRLVGYLRLEDFVPAVGARDGLPGEAAQDGLAFGVEVFHSPSLRLTVVLPRSPVIRARRLHHLLSLQRWVDVSGFAAVVVTAGVDAALRGDEGLRSLTPFRHFALPTSSPSSPSPLLSRLSSMIPPYVPSPSPSSPSSAAPSTGAPRIPLFPHGGLTRKVLEAFSLSAPSASEGKGEKEVEVAALTVYTSEGDARDAALGLADALVAVLALPPPGAHSGEGEVEKRVADLELSAAGATGGEGRKWEWKTPRSWETGLMGSELGREAGRDMFG